MFGRGRILTVVVTIGLAIGAGHFVQGGLRAPGAATPADDADGFVPLPVRPGSAALLSPRRKSLPQPTVASSVLRVPSPPAGVVAARSLPRDRLIPINAPRDVAVSPPSDAQMSLDGFGMACGSEVAAAPAPGGMIRLTLRAPCDPGATATVEHGEISFKAALGASGQMTLDVPAFRTDARIRVSVGAAKPTELVVQVPDAAEFDRVALVGADVVAMSIHALEFGAGAGSGGHVSAQRPHQPSQSEGTVIRLGDPILSEPKFAEIYSYPTAQSERQGTVRISVAARVTEANCGTTARVQTIHSTGGGIPPRVADLSVPMPDCDAVGRIMVLKNIVEDLMIARN